MGWDYLSEKWDYLLIDMDEVSPYAEYDVSPAKFTAKISAYFPPNFRLICRLNNMLYICPIFPRG